LYEELVRQDQGSRHQCEFPEQQHPRGDAARPGLNRCFRKTWLNLVLAFLFSTLFGVGAPCSATCWTTPFAIRSGGSAAELRRDRIPAAVKGLASPIEPDSSCEPFGRRGCPEREWQRQWATGMAMATCGIWGERQRPWQGAGGPVARQDKHAGDHDEILSNYEEAIRTLRNRSC